MEDRASVHMSGTAFERGAVPACLSDGRRQKAACARIFRKRENVGKEKRWQKRNIRIQLLTGRCMNMSMGRKRIRTAMPEDMLTGMHIVMPIRRLF